MRGVTVCMCLTLATCFIYINNLEVIPEGVKILYMNPKYMYNMSSHIRRNARNSPYVVNCEGTTLVPLDDNITVDFIFYEFLHNEYKRTFVELHFKGCKQLLNDRFMVLSQILKASNITCPLPPGRYMFFNVTINKIAAVEYLPYKWPFQKGKVMIYMRTFPEKELIAEFYGLLSFKQPAKKVNRNKN